MGVQGLWTILEPAARPVKLETLAKKRLAIDASIWIYQFLKAVRDKEGQALRNSHIVGFFRRICKLLFFGIKPVFVFDGGAPALKRQTLANRRQIREGRKEDAIHTAGKMIALQMRRRAAIEHEREKLGIVEDAQGDQIGDDVVYFAEVDLKPEERSRKFRKTDQYHLPNLEFPLERMANPNDTRILTEMELEQYAKDYHMLEDLSHYDFSALDFDSDYFRSLPPAEQYSILNAARLRSRLRMGYSKEQLDEMFPDRLAFSRFQIQRLKERNNYTQRLMNLNGMNDVGPQRVAGEKGREYFLVRNEGVEGGWVLGTSSKEGEKEKPVLLDVEPSVEEDDEVVDFEDIPLEMSQPENPPILKKTYGVETKFVPESVKGKDETLFVEDEDESAEGMRPDLLMESDEDEELRTAINLSLLPESQISKRGTEPIDLTAASEDDIYLGTPESDDSDLNRAIALSLAQQNVRPMSSDPADFDIQEALMMSPEQLENENSDFEDAEMLFERFPLTAKDKGKGKATSVTPEPADDELMKAIELSKRDVRLGDRMDGIGTSKDFGGVEESPLRSILGKSMFRKKQVPEASKGGDQTALSLSPRNHDVIEISDEAPQDSSLEEDVTRLSTIPIPATGPRAPSIPSEPPRKDFVDQGLTRPENRQTKITTIHLEDNKSKEDEEFDSISFEEPSQTAGQSQPAHAAVIASTQSPQSDGPDYISEDEDEQLMAQLAAEAEEHARFASSINPSASSRAEDYLYYPGLDANLDEESFEKEMRSLRNQQKKDRRDADETNQLMVVECQQLLRLFGLPYVTAPMEAEAQCAELVRLGLVDGIVTDDSDIFLFGGTRVYKNMFNQSKFVECYLQIDMERDFNLDRQRFINLAHLLGSDYAEGVSHIGPVNALELLSEFPSERGLEDFRDWWIAVQQGRAPKTGESEFRQKFRKNATKIFLSNDFPNRVIDQAYLSPQVDRDPQPFIWGVPDLDGLRTFLMSQIGWSKERTDEILVPVIKDMNRRQIEGGQTNLTEYFEGNIGSGTFAPRRKLTHRSKRLSKAMANLRRPESDDDVQEIAPRNISSKRKRSAPEVVKVESDDEPGFRREASAEDESSSNDDNVQRMQHSKSASAKRGNLGKKSGNARKRVSRRR